MEQKPKIIVVLGPTASGKSDLAVTLAEKFNGEVVSADSRQVYKGLTIGTGKITKQEMRGIPHHLLDVASPKKVFSVHEFQILADQAIEDILWRNKVPIICGGTGFYIQSIVDNYILPEVPPNPALREELSKKTDKELFLRLATVDLRRAANIDLKNPRRLIRAIEIAEFLGKVPEIKTNPKYQSLQIGLETDDTTLKEKIHTRLLERIKKGMLSEAKKLHKQGVLWKRMEELGLEYRYLARFLQKKYKNKKDEQAAKVKMLSELETEIWQYAKRQRTWFKRDTRIKWFKLAQKNRIVKEVRKFLD